MRAGLIVVVLLKRAGPQQHRAHLSIAPKRMQGRRSPVAIFCCRSYRMVVRLPNLTKMVTQSEWIEAEACRRRLGLGKHHRNETLGNRGVLPTSTPTWWP